MMDNMPTVDNEGGFIVPEGTIEPLLDALERYGRLPYRPTLYRRMWTWVEVQIRTIFRCRRCGRSRKPDGN